MTSLLRWLLSLGAVTAMATSAIAAPPAARDVLDMYADIALAGYEDSLTTANALKASIDAFLAEPTEAKLAEAKAAWLAARVPYQQTEVFRFGNGIVDDWEGKVNA